MGQRIWRREKKRMYSRVGGVDGEEERRAPLERT